MVDAIAKFLADAGSVELEPTGAHGSFHGHRRLAAVADQARRRAMRELVQEHHRRVRQSSDAFAGRELDLDPGDGLRQLRWPGAGDPLACTIRALNEVKARHPRRPATGECEQVEGKVFGVAVVTGSPPIAALGEAGDVLVSATVRDLVAGRSSRSKTAASGLKDLPEARQVYAVV